jgi:hypothetical protein
MNRQYGIRHRLNGYGETRWHKKMRRMRRNKGNRGQA